MGGTVVYQSYRADGGPAWLRGCLASVRAWADARGYTYRFLGDELFDRVPGPVRVRLAHQTNMLADVARLLVAQELHAEGFDRAIWIDADVRVLDAARFTVETTRGFAVARELWVEPRGDVAVDVRVNNCVCAFDAGAPFLPFYLDACYAVLAHTAGALSPLLLGTQLLTQLARAVPLTLLETVGMASPWVVQDLARGGGPHLAALCAHSPAPPAAVNFCASLRGRRFGSLAYTDELVEAAIARLDDAGAWPAAT